MSIDYGVVIEGKFQLTLDSGEKKVMLPGDMSKETSSSALSIHGNQAHAGVIVANIDVIGVNRGCMHLWKNLDEEKPGRMVFILLDVKPLKVNGEIVHEYLGEMEKDYVHAKH